MVVVVYECHSLRHRTQCSYTFCCLTIEFHKEQSMEMYRYLPMFYAMTASVCYILFYVFHFWLSMSIIHTHTHKRTHLHTYNMKQNRVCT